MTNRVDPCLSRKAQALWPEACVPCTIRRQSKAWSLERPRQALQPIRLGTPFKEVNRALRAISLAEHAHPAS
jgi:hypothetical protein